MPLSQIQLSSSTGRRNLVINGAMQVAQRGTSATGVTNNGSHFIIDRFKTVVNSSYTNTVEQSTDVPSGYGFVYSLKQTFTTAKSSPSSGDYNVLDQNLEKQNIYSTENGTSSAKSITLSFWVKSSVTGTFAVALQNYGSSRRSNVLSYTISSANTWEKKVITTTADPSANTNSANGSGLGLRFALSAGSSYEASNATTGWQTADYFGFNGATYPAGTTNATWQITGVQLEVGNVATEFEHRSFGEELKLCHRYYQQHDYATHGRYIANGGASSNSHSKYIYQYYGGTMRATPSISTPSVSNGYRFIGHGQDHSHSTIPNIDNPGANSVQFGNNQNTITAGRQMRLLISYNEAMIKMDAEL